MSPTVEASITVVANRPIRLSTAAASARYAIIPQKVMALVGDVNHFENRSSAKPAAESNAGARHDAVRNVQSATAAMSARGPAKRAQPFIHGTKALEVSYRPRPMTKTSPVVAADQAALTKDQSAGSSKMAPAAKVAFPYCFKLKWLMKMNFDVMADCGPRECPSSRDFETRTEGRTWPSCAGDRDPLDLAGSSCTCWPGP